MRTNDLKQKYWQNINAKSRKKLQEVRVERNIIRRTLRNKHEFFMQAGTVQPLNMADQRELV